MNKRKAIPGPGKIPGSRATWIVHPLMCTILTDTNIGEIVAKHRLKKIKRFNDDAQRRKSKHVNVLSNKKFNNKIRKPVSAYKKNLSEPFIINKTVRYQKKMVDKYMDVIFKNKTVSIPIFKSPYKYELTKVNNDANLFKKRSICKERKEKRRNLFRTGRAGKGVAGPIKKLITAKSNVRC